MDGHLIDQGIKMSSSAFVQVSSSSHDRKRPAGQICICEAFSQLAKYEQDSGKWKMLAIYLATYAEIPIPDALY